ncbi:signal transduction histidine kinase [Flammeovirgaceae bacterium 311]|nr:signal transduction histidine kinase [Flammeovirgaceae bacterium 311]
MAVPALVVPVFPGREHFKALYNPVNSPVFLLHTGEGLVLAHNVAFSACFYTPEVFTDTPKAATIILATPHHVQAVRQGKVSATLQLPDGNRQALELELADAMLGDESVLLCFVQDQLSHNSQQIALAAAEAEKKALLNEVYHRVKNNLNIIISLLKLQMNRVQDPGVRKLLLESKSRIFTLALLQERLYLSPRLSEVKANEYLISLAHSVVNTFKGGQQISLHTHSTECWLKVDTLVPLGLLVHELVSNAVVHAFSAQEQGQVHLFFGPAGDTHYELIIADDGKGLSPQIFEGGKTLGVQLINSLVKQLKAHKQLETAAGAGTKIIISLPKPLA